MFTQVKSHVGIRLSAWRAVGVAARGCPSPGGSTVAEAEALAGGSTWGRGKDDRGCSIPHASALRIALRKRQLIGYASPDVSRQLVCYVTTTVVVQRSEPFAWHRAQHRPFRVRSLLLHHLLCTVIQ